MKIAIDSDINGRELKKILIEYIKENNYNIYDLNFLESNPELDYPDVAFNLSYKIRDNEFDRGILICGTGLGMTICANKVEGVYAGACSDVYAAQRLIKSNDAQILGLGTYVVGKESAKVIAKAFLEGNFEGEGLSPK